MVDVAPEAAHTAAAARGGRDAMPYLASCVGCSETFLAEYWDKAPMVTVGSAGRFTDIFSLAELDRLLSMGAISDSLLKVLKVGVAVPVHAFTRSAWSLRRSANVTADCARIAELIAGGYTLQALDIDHVSDGLAALCAGLEAELSHHTWATAFVTPPMSQGLAAHSDKYGVFVLQIHGSKRWNVYKRRSEAARTETRIALDPAEHPVLSVILHSGDTLYVPPGYVHEVKSLQNLSMHISIGVVHARLADFIRYALDWYADRPDFLESLPPAFSTEAAAPAELIRDCGTKVSRFFQDEVQVAEAFSAFSATWMKKRHHDTRGLLTAVADLGGHPDECA
jgi:ribosomal protein L16 Arg81 hydroxylase